MDKSSSPSLLVYGGAEGLVTKYLLYGGGRYLDGPWKMLPSRCGAMKNIRSALWAYGNIWQNWFHSIKQWKDIFHFIQANGSPANVYRSYRL